jgi:hypothetical protein
VNTGSQSGQAYRGARSFAPENTIPGYDAGLAIGTHWVDMDVVMTRASSSRCWPPADMRCL